MCLVTTPLKKRLFKQRRTGRRCCCWDDWDGVLFVDKSTISIFQLLDVLKWPKGFGVSFFSFGWGRILLFVCWSSFGIWARFVGNIKSENEGEERCLWADFVVNLLVYSFGFPACPTHRPSPLYNNNHDDILFMLWYCVNHFCLSSSIMEHCPILLLDFPEGVIAGFKGYTAYNLVSHWYHLLCDKWVITSCIRRLKLTPFFSFCWDF